MISGEFAAYCGATIKSIWPKLPLGVVSRQSFEVRLKLRPITLLKMLVIFYFAFAFVFIFPVSLSTYRCREFNVYKKKCEIYDFSVQNCEKWDKSHCPKPRIQENTYCPVYSCWKVRHHLYKISIFHICPYCQTLLNTQLPDLGTLPSEDNRNSSTPPPRETSISRNQRKKAFHGTKDKAVGFLYALFPCPSFTILYRESSRTTECKPTSSTYEKAHASTRPYHRKNSEAESASDTSANLCSACIRSYDCSAFCWENYY